MPKNKSPKTESKDSKISKGSKTSILSKSVASSTTEKNWRDYLKSTPISNDFFNYDTLFVVESNSDCFSIIDNVVQEVERMEQSSIRTISSENVKSLANGTINTKSFGDLLPIAKKGIADAKLEIKKNGNISTETEALLIKLIILVIRNQYLSHKENYLELQKAIEEEYTSLTKVESEEKGKGKGKGKEKAPKGKEAKGKKGKEPHSFNDICDQINAMGYSNVNEIRKKMKNLKQSEDFQMPHEGIDLYFALIKIYNYELIDQLTEIGVNVTCLLDVSTDEKEFSTTVYHKTPFEGSLPPEDVRQIDISNFWRASGIAKGDVLFQLPKKTCYLRYCPHDPETTYNDLLRIAKNITDLQRLHKIYLENLKILNVNETKTHIKIKKMKTYNKILDRVPNELQSIPVILHALVEEVASRLPSDEHAAEQAVEHAAKYPNPYENFELHKDPPPQKMKRHYGPRNQLLELFKKFEREKRIRTIPKEVTICKTKVIPYGNSLEYQLNHAPYSSELKQINIDALKKITPLQLFNFCSEQNAENILIYHYLFHRWAKEFEAVPPSRLMHCIHAYLMKHGKFFDAPRGADYLPKTKVEELLFLDAKPYNENIPERPVVYFNNLLSKSTRKQAKVLEEFQEAKWEKVKYCEHFEEYDPETMIQMVNMAFQYNPHYDCKFFPGHDTILLRFTHESEGQSEPAQFMSLRTPVCFRDFCGHVLSRDTDWLYIQEYCYWKQKAAEQMVSKKECLEDLYKFDEKDFIIPGSIKDRLLKEEEASQKKGKPADKGGKKKSSSSPKQSSSAKLAKNDKSSSGSPLKSDTLVKDKPEASAAEETEKVYVYEGYNIKDTLFQLIYDSKQFFTSDAYKIIITKYKWSMDEEKISIKICISDNNIIFNLRKKKGSLTSRPFHFQLHIVNGIIMKFELPPPPKTYVYPCNKRIATYSYTKPASRDISTATLIRAAPIKKRNNVPKEGTYIKSKKEILEHIKVAAHTNIPIFKICSTRLHKFLYVKRVKSHIEVPVGKIIQRLTYKPKIFVKPERIYTVQQSLPPIEIDEANFHEVDLIWKASLPTGLFIQALQGPKTLYIKQGYIIDRADMPSLDNEDYRCILRGKVISFRKNGEVTTMYFDKVLEYRQYGYFSSNSKTSNKELRRLSRSSYQIHKVVNKTSKLERKIKRICERFVPHLIDLSTNYHLESKHATMKKEKLVCKLSRKLHEQVPTMLPLLKLVTITSNGSKITKTTKSELVEDKKYFITNYNDYLKRETLLYREDGTTWYLDNKGFATTQFPDSTRITTWATELDENFHVSFEEDYQMGEEEIIFETDYGEGTMMVEENVVGGNEKKKFPCRNDYITEPYVLYGLNYKYEHPNYLTIVEHCTEDIIEVLMPDDVVVKVFPDGTYNIKLPNKETINVDLNTVRVNGRCCESCKEKVKCSINTRPLYFKVREDKPADNFIKLYDIYNKIILVDFKGNVKEEPTINERFPKCFCKKQILSRYFVLRRDLSGAELFEKPKANRFLCILDNFEVNISEDKNQASTHLMKFLYKTYTEHLMMLYDLPLLGMLNNFNDSEEIFKVFDFDEKAIISLRKPLYLLERKIYHLYFYKFIKSLASGFHYFLHDRRIKLFKPSISLLNFIEMNKCKTKVAETPKVSPVDVTRVSKPKVDNRRKLHKRKDMKAIEERLKILQEPVPKYFDSREGSMFLIINSCIEKAFQILKNKEILEKQKEKISAEKNSSKALDKPQGLENSSEDKGGKFSSSKELDKSIVQKPENSEEKSGKFNSSKELNKSFSKKSQGLESPSRDKSGKLSSPKELSKSKTQKSGKSEEKSGNFSSSKELDKSFVEKSKGLESSSGYKNNKFSSSKELDKSRTPKSGNPNIPSEVYNEDLENSSEEGKVLRKDTELGRSMPKKFEDAKVTSDECHKKFSASKELNRPMPQKLGEGKVSSEEHSRKELDKSLPQNSDNMKFSTGKINNTQELDGGVIKKIQSKISEEKTESFRHFQEKEPQSMSGPKVFSKDSKQHVNIHKPMSAMRISSTGVLLEAVPANLNTSSSYSMYTIPSATVNDKSHECEKSCHMKRCTSGCRSICPRFPSPPISLKSKIEQQEKIIGTKMLSSTNLDKEKKIPTLRTCRSVCEVATCPELCQMPPVTKTTSPSFISEHNSEIMTPITKYAKTTAYCNPIKCCPDPPNTSEASLCERVIITTPPTIEDGEAPFNESTAAIEILQSLRNTSYTRNIDDLTKKQIHSALLSQLKYLPLTADRAKDLKNKLSSLLGMGRDTVFNTAVEVIQEMKRIIALKNEKSLRSSFASPAELDTIALKTSVIMYNILDTTNTTDTVVGIELIKELFQETRICKEDAYTVLQMTAESLVDDLIGSKYILGHVVKDLIPGNAETSKMIIETLDEITKKLLNRSPSFTQKKGRAFSSKKTLSAMVSMMKKSKDRIETSKTKLPKKSLDASAEKLNKDELKILHEIQKRRFTCDTIKSDEKPINRSKDKPINRSKDKPINRSKDKSIDRFKDKSIDRFKDKSIDRFKDKSIDRPVDGPIDKSKDKHIESPKDGPIDKSVERPKDKPIDRPKDKDKSLTSKISKGPIGSPPKKQPGIRRSITQRGKIYHITHFNEPVPDK